MSAQTTSKLHIIGGGLAGCEAAMAAANLGVPVILHEMRGPQKTFAHQTDTLAELVCSNSLRSDDATANAVGVLHEELRRSGSVVMRSADQHKVPATFNARKSMAGHPWIGSTLSSRLAH